MVMASELSVGSKVLDYLGNEVDVTWSEKHKKMQRVVVDLFTKSCMLTVTGSHRIVAPDGNIEAHNLKKGDEVLITGSSGCEKLQKVTKRYGYSPVVELEFRGDATMAVCVPTILTKGANALTPTDQGAHTNCKEEVPDESDALMHGSMNGAAGGNSHINEASTPMSMMDTEEKWPDTDDEFR